MDEREASGSGSGEASQDEPENPRGPLQLENDQFHDPLAPERKRAHEKPKSAKLKKKPRRMHNKCTESEPGRNHMKG